MQPTNPYDAIVYAAQPHPETAPHHVGALGVLLGLSPAPPERCRVLEIGCATAGNLFNLAESFPATEFVGIDPSSRQIDIGRKVVADLGLGNLRLECLGAEALDGDWGRFDYIICHGVYSWVPPPVREGILATCRRLLNPHGIAYVSYNTKPGFHLRQPVREMMLWHARGIDDPMARVAQSRALLKFISENIYNRDGAWSRLVGEEIDLFGPRGDFYLAHEHLSQENEAFYFHEFVEAARRHGLQYLAEASHHLDPSPLPPEARTAIEGMSEDLVAMEQYVDFLNGRMFRRTLLVHAEANIQRAAPPDVLSRLYLAALASPTSAGVPLGPAETVEFKNDDGARVEMSLPVTKTALLELYERFPLALSWPQLWEATAARLEAADIRATDEQRAVLASWLTRLYLARLVHLQSAPSPFIRAVSERPLTSRLARLQAGSGVPVTSRRHVRTEVDPFGLALLPLLDGTRDRAALAEGLSARVTWPGLSPEEARGRLDAELGPALFRLARSALLIG